MAPGATQRAAAPGRAWGWAIVALAIARVLLGTDPEKSYGDTLFSRLATLYSLTETGSWAIADSGRDVSNPFESKTVDKVVLDGKVYSTKPPLLPLFMTGEYLALRPFVGGLVTDTGKLPLAAWIFSVTWSGLPYVLMVVAIWFAARTALPGAVAAPAGLAFAAAAGTQAAAFAGVFNNHVIAAAGVAASFCLAFRLRERESTLDFILFGVAAGLCATADAPSAVFPALLGVWLAMARFRGLLIFALPAAVTLVAIQSLALYSATGSPLPVQMHGEWYLTENSYWRNPGGVDALADPKGIYLIHITFGRDGIFSLFPITLLGIAGVFVAWRRPGASHRAISSIAVLGTAILLAYYALSTNNYGGEAFGFRWSIAAAPALLVAGIPAVGAIRRRWVYAVCALLLAISMFSAYQGSQHPWESGREWTTRVLGSPL